MKIILANKFHYQKAGAERCYFDTAKILSEKGHEVAFFSTKNPKNEKTEWEKYFVPAIDYNKKNSILSALKAFFDILYNRRAKKNILKLIGEFKPSLVHLHNIYRQLSPSIVDALAKNGVPIVMTLHDFNLVSPARTLSARGQIWEKSFPDKYWRCFFDRCVKDSYSQSFAASCEIAYHKWSKVYDQIGCFISPSRFLIDKYRQYGFKGKLRYLPNPVICSEEMIQAPAATGDYILYFGRLGEEKGVDDLLSAYKGSGVSLALKIVGDGESAPFLKKMAKREKIAGVEFLGHRSGQNLWSLVKGARLVVFTTRCYENAPYALLETMLLGRAALAPDFAGYKELIKDGETGYFYGFGQVGDLAEKIKRLAAENPAELVGEAARRFVQENNSPERYYQGLLEIYQQTK